MEPVQEARLIDGVRDHAEKDELAPLVTLGHGIGLELPQEEPEHERAQWKPQRVEGLRRELCERGLHAAHVAAPDEDDAEHEIDGAPARAHAAPRRSIAARAKSAEETWAGTRSAAWSATCRAPGGFPRRASSRPPTATVAVPTAAATCMGAESWHKRRSNCRRDADIWRRLIGGRAVCGARSRAATAARGSRASGASSRATWAPVCSETWSSTSAHCASG